MEARAPLGAIRTRLEELAGRLQSGAWHTRIVRSAVVLSGLATALSVAYLRSDLGLRLERVEGLSPPVAYQAITTSDSELVPEDDYLRDYMLEFSKSYFEQESQFLSLYFDKSKDGDMTQRRTLQHKISLRNASHGLVKYVSSVEAVVQSQGEAEFPWRRLTFTSSFDSRRKLRTRFTTCKSGRDRWLTRRRCPKVAGLHRLISTACTRSFPRWHRCARSQR
jgi:hypothetical protein